MTVLAVLLGGFLGAPARVLVDGLVADRAETDFPLGTFVVNCSGALALGLLTGLDLSVGLPRLLVMFLGVGLLGAYTTFSTVTAESVALLADGEYAEALGYLGASLVVGLAVAGVGLALGLAA